MRILHHCIHTKSMNLNLTSLKLLIIFVAMCSLSCTQQVNKTFYYEKETSTEVLNYNVKQIFTGDPKADFDKVEFDGKGNMQKLTRRYVQSRTWEDDSYTHITEYISRYSFGYGIDGQKMNVFRLKTSYPFGKNLKPEKYADTLKFDIDNGHLVFRSISPVPWVVATTSQYLYDKQGRVIKYTLEFTGDHRQLNENEYKYDQFGRVIEDTETVNHFPWSRTNTKYTLHDLHHNWLQRVSYRQFLGRTKQKPDTITTTRIITYY